MKLLEFADIIDKEIVIIYYPNQNCRFSASFDGAEIMDRGFLLGNYGNGKTPEESLKDYTKQIVGKRIVFGAYTDNRKEFVVPDEFK